MFGLPEVYLTIFLAVLNATGKKSLFLLYQDNRKGGG